MEELLGKAINHERHENHENYKSNIDKTLLLLQFSNSCFSTILEFLGVLDSLSCLSCFSW